MRLQFLTEDILFEAHEVHPRLLDQILKLKEEATEKLTQLTKERPDITFIPQDKLQLIWNNKGWIIGNLYVPEYHLNNQGMNVVERLNGFVTFEYGLLIAKGIDKFIELIKNKAIKTKSELEKRHKRVQKIGATRELIRIIKNFFKFYTMHYDYTIIDKDLDKLTSYAKNYLENLNNAYGIEIGSYLVSKINNKINKSNLKEFELNPESNTSLTGEMHDQDQWGVPHFSAIFTIDGRIFLSMQQHLYGESHSINREFIGWPQELKSVISQLVKDVIEKEKQREQGMHHVETPPAQNP